MKENLISKKELLEVMGISYGQLYRWKRKNLIPEEWFIKKSSYTGQETYFPKDKIIERIIKILSLKDEVPLDDMAEYFTHKKVDKELTSEYILSKGVVQPSSLYIYKSFNRSTKEYEFYEVIIMSVIERILMIDGFKEIYVEDSVKMLIENKSMLEENNVMLIGIAKNENFTPFIVKEYSAVAFPNNFKEVFKINISLITEDIKMKLFN